MDDIKVAFVAINYERGDYIVVNDNLDELKGFAVYLKRGDNAVKVYASEIGHWLETSSTLSVACKSCYDEALSHATTLSQTLGIQLEITIPVPKIRIEF